MQVWSFPKALSYVSSGVLWDFLTLCLSASFGGKEFWHAEDLHLAHHAQRQLHKSSQVKAKGDMTKFDFICSIPVLQLHFFRARERWDLSKNIAAVPNDLRGLPYQHRQVLPQSSEWEQHISDCWSRWVDGRYEYSSCFCWCNVGFPQTSAALRKVGAFYLTGLWDAH